MSTAVATLPHHEQEIAESEWPFHVGLVALNDQIVDQSYQRPEDQKFVDENALVFDPTLVGTIDVSLRSNGMYAVLDGQQRRAMMLKVGKTTCYCSIYQGLTIEDEAGFFFRKNKDCKTMKPYYGFRARVVAGDEEARAIQRVVEGSQFTIGPNPDDRDTVSAIRSAELAYSYSAPHRPESLSPTLTTIRESVYGRKGSLDANLILTLGRFWQTYSDEEVNAELVQEVLSEFGPVNFLGVAKERQATTKALSRPWTGAQILAEEYNRRLRGGRRGKVGGQLDLSRVTKEKV